MKYLIFNFLILNIFLGCAQKTYRPYIDDYTNGPIVDYTKKSYENKIFSDKIIKKYNEQTVILFDDQIINVNRFNELINTNQLRIIKILKDSQDIENLGYSYTKVKTIILTTKQ